MKTEVFHFSVFVHFHFLYSDISVALYFGANLVAVVVAFSNDSGLCGYIEYGSFSSVSVFRSLHFEQRFQLYLVSIVLNGNARPKRSNSLLFSYETE